MEHRYFEFLYAEICVAVGRRVSRYDLWLLVWETGGDPGDLSRRQVERFIEGGLETLLIEENARLAPRVLRRLCQRLLAFDPRFPTPEEWLARLGQRAA